MTNDEYTATRRGALAAIAAAAAVGTVPVTAVAAGVDRSAWNSAMAKWCEAKRLEQAAVAEWNLSRTADSARHAAADERLNAATDAEADAHSALLLMPAPDGEALMWKLEYLYGPETLESEDGEHAPAWYKPIVDAYMADARRLLTTAN